MLAVLHCRECGAGLNDRLLLLSRDLCEGCQAEDDRLYGPEDDEPCPFCGDDLCFGNECLDHAERYGW